MDASYFPKLLGFWTFAVGSSRCVNVLVHFRRCTICIEDIIECFSSPAYWLESKSSESLYLVTCLLWLKQQCHASVRYFNILCCCFLIYLICWRCWLSLLIVESVIFHIFKSWIPACCVIYKLLHFRSLAYMGFTGYLTPIIGVLKYLTAL